MMIDELVAPATLSPDTHFHVPTGEERWWVHVRSAHSGGEEGNPCSCRELNPDRPARN
jgi:hypothetical protein